VGLTAAQIEALAIAGQSEPIPALVVALPDEFEQACAALEGAILD
jgi:hypothetical protein